jgi:hypothetical protein
MPGIDREFSPQHQARILTPLHNLLKKAAEDLHAIAFANTGQAGMFG